MPLSYAEITSNGQSSQSLSFTFDYLNQSDISVYVDGVLKTRPSDWDFTTTQTISFVSHPASGAVIRIERNTPATTRNVDFQDGSVLSEADLDDSADQIFFIAQEASDTADSAITVTPDGKWDAQSRVIKNVADPVNAQDAATKNYLENTWLTASDKTQLNNLNLTNLNTVANDVANVNTTAGSIANVNTTAGSINNVNSVAGNISNVNAVAGNATNINAVNSNATNINTVSTDISNVNTVSGSIANVNTVAARDANIGTVAARDADIGTVANRDADIGTVANRAADIQTVANDLNEPVSEIDTVATNITNVNTVGTGIANVNTVATNIANVNSVANDATDIGTVATNINNVNTVAGNDTNITTVAGISNDVTTVATNASNISTIASDIADVIAVANDLNEATSEIDTVAQNITNVNTVGTAITNVNTVATNIADVNSFADTYFISATAPASPTTGDLWFDTTNNTMKVYGGSGFQNAGSSVNGTAQRVTFTATAGQTTFAATYDAGYVDVYLNGVKLIAGTDFTATNGTSVVLATGAAVNDTVDIVAYGTFQLSNFSINDANDVNAAGASTGQFLKWDGTNWVGDTVNTDLVVDTTPQLGGVLDAQSNSITSVDKIGIGVSSPAYKVQIEQDANQTPFLYIKNTGTNGCHNAVLLESSTTADKNIGIRFQNSGGIKGGIGYIQNGTMALYGGTTTNAGVNVNGNGHVMLPSQPCFWVDQTNGANSLSAGSLPSNTVIQFNGVRLNRGNHYSTSTNRFTAPVSGLYQFSFNTVFDNNGSNNVRVFEFAFVINGSTDFGFSSLVIRNWNSGNEHPTLNMTDVQYLNANDYVEVKTRTHTDSSGGTLGIRNGRACFSGYLVG